jgi:hypothetical protein
MTIYSILIITLITGWPVCGVIGYKIGAWHEHDREEDTEFAQTIAELDARPWPPKMDDRPARHARRYIEHSPPRMASFTPHQQSRWPVEDTIIGHATTGALRALTAEFIAALEADGEAFRAGMAREEAAHRKALTS